MIEAKKQIGFEQAGLGSILKHNQLVVPPNQREYAWTGKQVKQLFQDFAKAISDGGDYFLGTIVTIPRQNGSLEVVDGQQRLATSAILLAAIRDYLSGKGEDILVESIDNEFLTGIDRSRRVRIPKLKLNVDDNDLFARIVSDEPATGNRASHERLLAAAAEARAHVQSVVASHDPKDHGDVLNRWVSFIEHRALGVLLRVPDDADAYKMFETLNDRGLKTSQADLIKNFLFGRSSERISEVQTKWAYMRGALESLEDDDISTVNFLRHALIVMRGFLREAEVYEVVQDYVKSEVLAVQMVSDLERLATAYIATFNPEHERWNDYPDSARRAIEVFNLLNIKPMRPLILAITIGMNPNSATEAFRFLVSLGVRLLIASSTRSGSVELPLADAAHRVFNKTLETPRELMKRLGSITPSDGEFFTAFGGARVSNARLARYYLRSLETAAQDEDEPWFIPISDRAVINLEHILPKKPETNWPRFSVDDRKLYTNRLGNLTLLKASDNSKSRSDAFEDKKPLYNQSPYLITKYILNFDDWSTESIGDRQTFLAELALKAWPLKLGSKERLS